MEACAFEHSFAGLSEIFRRPVIWEFTVSAEAPEGIASNKASGEVLKAYRRFFNVIYGVQ